MYKWVVFKIWMVKNWWGDGERLVITHLTDLSWIFVNA